MASLLLWTHGTWPWEQRAAAAFGPSASEAEALSAPRIVLAADISSFQHPFPCAPMCLLSESCPELLQCYRIPCRVSSQPLTVPDCGRRALLTGLITERFPPSASPGSGLSGCRASQRLPGLREERAPTRKAKAVKYPPSSRKLASRWPVLTGLGCVLRPQPRILSLFSQW